MIGRGKKSTLGPTSSPELYALMRVLSEIPWYLSGNCSIQALTSSGEGGGPCGRALRILILAWMARTSGCVDAMIRHDQAARHYRRREGESEDATAESFFGVCVRERRAYPDRQTEPVLRFESRAGHRYFSVSTEISIAPFPLRGIQRRHVDENMERGVIVFMVNHTRRDEHQSWLPRRSRSVRLS